MVKKELSCGAVVFREVEEIKLFLLLLSPGGYWDFPKGHVEGKESAEACARREVQEETGIRDMVFVKGFEEKIHYFFTREKKLVSKEVIYVLARANQEKVLLSLEHKDFAWLAFHKARDKITFKTSKEVLIKAERFLREY